MNKVKLSKTVSYILRHHPESFDLKLAADGSLNLNDLVKALKRKFPELDREDLIQLVENDPKGRFSLLKSGERIRANYGHSIDEVDPDYEEVKPPKYLYHGTTPKVRNKILREGLKPMGRNYTHLSATVEEAVKVGQRRTNSPLIFKINAEQAFEDGLKFYKTGEDIYLIDQVPVKYLEILKEK